MKYVGTDLLKMRQGAEPRGTARQGGVRGFTLCIPCNTQTGRMYGGAFVEWADRGAQVLLASEGDPRLAQPFRIYPLRVLKQIATMFFSVNPPQMGDRYPDLRQFVLSRDKTGLPPDLRFHVSYSTSPLIRMIGDAHRLDIKTGRILGISEITFPPFAYTFAIGQGVPDSRQTEISWFSRYGYTEQVELVLPIRRLPVVGLYPGDYRSTEEIERRLRPEGQG